MVKKIKLIGRSKCSGDGGWSEPEAVTTFNGKPSGPGVYQLLAIRDKERLAIPRILKNDPEGRLYWGAAPTNLEERVTNLVKSLRGQQPAHVQLHGAGERYHKIRSLNRAFPLQYLWVRFWKIDISPMRPLLAETIRAQNRGEAITEAQEILQSLGKLKKVPDLADDDWLDETVAFLFERSGLWHYEQEFGELPPLNILPGRHTY